MKRVRITRAGASRTPARMCSRSRSRPSPLGRRASGTATTTETGTAEAPGLTRSAISCSSYAYAFFSSPSAHLAASSGFMPLMAWAYISTRMYLTRTSEAFRLGWPGYPGQRPNFDDSLKGTSLGAPPQQGVLRQVGGGPQGVPVVRRLPFVVRRPIHEPAQELLPPLLVFGVFQARAPLTANSVEAARGPPRHVGMVHGLGDLGEL